MKGNDPNTSNVITISRINSGLVSPGALQPMDKNSIFYLTNVLKTTTRKIKSIRFTLAHGDTDALPHGKSLNL